MEIIYRNHIGEEINLNSDNIILQSTDLFNWEYTYTTLDGKRPKSIDYKRTSKVINLELLLLPDLEMDIYAKNEYKEFLNRQLFNCIHKDVVSQKKGRLYLDDFYVEGLFIGSEKVDSLKEMGFKLLNLKFLTDNPNFIKENTTSFNPGSGVAYTGIDYPYNYSYTYTNSKLGNSRLTRGHFAESEFKLSIFGPVSNPRISINENVYSIKDDIGAGEVIEINSKDFKVIKRNQNGDEENIFDKRDAIENIFRKIPGGNLEINWSGIFGFELTIFEERSEYGYLS